MPPGFFSGDEGVKLAQSQALIANGWQSFALPYPGSEVDPGGDYFPLKTPFVWTFDGRWFGIYSFEWTAAAALVWGLAGLRGVFLLSWLGAAAALWLFATLSARVLPTLLAAIAVATVAGGTPLLLYGTTNYEHTWACALLFGALTLVAHPEPPTSRLLVSGALLGLAAAIRPELFLFPLGFAGFAVVYWGWTRRTFSRLAVAAVGAATVSGLHLLLNRFFFGSFHPNLGAANHPQSTWELNLEKLVDSGTPGWALWILPVAVVVGLLPPRAFRWVQLPISLVISALLAWATWLALEGVTPAINAPHRTLVGLFTATPIAVLGLLRIASREDRPDLASALATCATVFVAAVVLVKIPGFWGGLEVGSRYLLPAAPLLVLAGWSGVLNPQLRARRAVALCTAALLGLVSLRATVVNAQSMVTIRRHGADLIAGVEATDVEDVITWGPWTASVLAPVFPQRRVYGQADDRLLRALADAGRRRVVAVDGQMSEGVIDGVVVTRDRVVGPKVVVWGLTLEPMLEWIDSNLPAGVGILREEGTPRPDPRQYRLGHRPSIARAPRHYVERREWDFVLVATGNYDNLTRLGSQSRDEVIRRYESILGWPLAAEFPAVGRAASSASRVALYRIPRAERAYRTSRRWSVGEESWISDETVRPPAGEGPLVFRRRWQPVVYRGLLRPGRYEIRLEPLPRRREAYLNVVTAGGLEVGSFGVGRRTIVELPERETYLIRVFLAPGSTLSGVIVRPAPADAELSPRLPEPVG